jgi:hypothetical protein
MATTYAICKDVTSHRATVARILPTESHLRAEIDRLGSTRLDLCAVAITRDDPVEIGERIWHGPQAVGVMEVK